MYQKRPTGYQTRKVRVSRNHRNHRNSCPWQLGISEKCVIRTIQSFHFLRLKIQIKKQRTQGFIPQGPLINKRQFDRVVSLVDSAKKSGVKVVTGEGTTYQKGSINQTIIFKANFVLASNLRQTLSVTVILLGNRRSVTVSDCICPMICVIRKSFLGHKTVTVAGFSL